MSIDRRTHPALSRLALSLIGTLAIWAQASRAEPPRPESMPAPVVTLVAPPTPRVSASPRVAAPVLEPDAAGVAPGPSPFGGKAAPLAAGQTLTAPVTINANTSTDALTATQTGTGRALNGVINNSSSTLTALKGATNGKGAALGGLNSGTAGPGGQFQVTNASNAQPGLVSTTAGTGNAVQGVVTTTGNTDVPAVLGQHNATNGYGIGVEGDGGYIGVRAIGAGGYGVYATTSSGYGVYAASDSGIGIYGNAGTSAGVYGNSTSNAGIFGTSYTGNGVTGITSTASGNSAYGVFGQGDNSYGVVGVSANGTGMSARSTNGYGITVTSSNAIGVYAYTGSPSSYAGYFIGQLRTTSTMTAQSYATTSDRNEKQSFEAIDGATVLDKISALPISAWDYKDKPGIRHIGPMAQDFRAAFGLGADDKHIDLVDAAGVSFAAIQALRLQVKERDARIEALEARAVQGDVALAAVDALAQRLTAVERAQAASASMTPAAAPAGSP